jgi:hypothetical protein
MRSPGISIRTSGGDTGSGADVTDTVGAVGFALIFHEERTEFFRHRERFSSNFVTHLRAKETYLEESYRLGTWNSVILASFYFEMYKFHDEIPIRI